MRYYDQNIAEEEMPTTLNETLLEKYPDSNNQSKITETFGMPDTAILCECL